MYLLLKTIHILSVVLFLGNIITGLFWKAQADSTRDSRLQAHALRGVIRSDAVFTIPAVVLIIATGVWLALEGGLPLLGTRWIAWSLIAFAISGILFGVFVAPMQRRMMNEALAATQGDEWPSAAYRRMSRIWETAGIVAILLPLGALALMVYKPT